MELPKFKKRVECDAFCEAHTKAYAQASADMNGSGNGRSSTISIMTKQILEVSNAV